MEFWTEHYLDSDLAHQTEQHSESQRVTHWEPHLESLKVRCWDSDWEHQRAMPMGFDLAHPMAHYWVPYLGFQKVTDWVFPMVVRME